MHGGGIRSESTSSRPVLQTSQDSNSTAKVRSLPINFVSDFDRARFGTAQAKRLD